MTSTSTTTTTTTIAVCGESEYRNEEGRCARVSACTDGEFESTAPTATSDRVCDPCGSCTPGEEYVQTPCGERADITCAPLSTCDVESEFEVLPATATSDRVCVLQTVCSPSAGEYASTPATATSDAACSPLSECAVFESETAAPTATSDRVCSCIGGDNDTSVLSMMVALQGLAPAIETADAAEQAQFLTDLVESLSASLSVSLANAMPFSQQQALVLGDVSAAESVKGAIPIPEALRKASEAGLVTLNNIHAFFGFHSCAISVQDFGAGVVSAATPVSATGIAAHVASEKRVWAQAIQVALPGGTARALSSASTFVTLQLALPSEVVDTVGCFAHNEATDADGIFASKLASASPFVLDTTLIQASSVTATSGEDTRCLCGCSPSTIDPSTGSGRISSTATGVIAVLGVLVLL